MSGEPRVAVIGAGLAGLAAAVELARRGLAVAVFEREAEPGGLARSERGEGLVLEPHSPVVSTGDDAWLALVAAVGAQDRLLPLRPVLAGQGDGRRVTELEPRGVLDVARIPGVRAREALRLMRLPRLLRRYGSRLDADRPEAAAPLDDRSVGDFTRLYFGASVLDGWVAPMVRASSLDDPEEVSRALWLRHTRQHFGARRALPRAPLSELVEAAAGRTPLLCGAEVRGIARSGGDELVIEYDRNGVERRVGVHAAVIAVDPAGAARVAAPLLTSGDRARLAAMRSIPSVALCARTCRPLSWHPREIRVASGVAPVATLLIEPGMAGGRVADGYGGVSIHATGAWSERMLHLPDETVEKELLEVFGKLVPGGPAAVDSTRVFRTEAARPRFGVGHYRALERLDRLEAERLTQPAPVVLAGGYRVDPSWNGAVASGFRAARAVARALRA